MPDTLIPEDPGAILAQKLKAALLGHRYSAVIREVDLPDRMRPKKRGTESKQLHVRPAGRYMTVAQAAIYMGRSDYGLRWMIRQKQIEVIRCGRRLHLDREDIDRFMSGRKWSQTTD
jgi:excisionase family DNA binding protein